jgi:hypothetical protein
MMGFLSGKGEANTLRGLFYEEIYELEYSKGIPAAQQTPLDHVADVACRAISGLLSLRYNSLHVFPKGAFSTKRRAD